jgi:hypothetical protein
MELHGKDNSLAERLIVGKEDISVLPSELLKQKIKDLPTGSKVAIEITQEIIDNPEKYNLTKAAVVYWELIIEHCHSLGHEIIFIGDQQILSETMEAEEEINNYYQSQDALDPSLDKERQLAVKNILAQRAITAYFYYVERENRILLNIVESDPEMVIVGKDIVRHLERSEFRRRIEVDSYTIGREDYPVDEDGNVDDSTEELMIWDSEKDAIVLADQEEKKRQIITRKYNAYTTGRIHPDKVCDWIGSWSTEAPHEGLFEVYIQQASKDGKEVSGIIDDINGPAFFYGGVIGNRLYFTKYYIPEVVLIENYIKDEIQYTAGLGEDGNYYGKWAVDDKQQLRGGFVLKKGSTYFAPEELYQPNN